MFLTGIEGKYDKELLKNRMIIEGNVIGSVWKDSSLIKEWRIEEKEFITIDGFLYYRMANELYQSGYRTLDELALTTFLNDKPDLKKWWESKGSYATIHKLSILINEENVDKYLDDFIKNNIILKLYEKGFRYSEDELKKFDNFNSEELYRYYDFLLNGVFVNMQLKGISPILLADKVGFLKFIEQCSLGNTGAMSISSSSASILNYHIGGGLQKGCLHLIGATSGEGKSTILIPLIILPLLRQNEKLLIMANEEDENSWYSKLLVSVINIELNYQGFTRQRLQQGHFTVQEVDIMNKAVEWLNQYKDNIVFIKLTDYKVATMEKIIHKYSNLGFENVIIDTFKPSSETENSWTVFTEDAKSLFQVAHQKGIRLIATIQLGISASGGVRYLNNNCIARARSIAEVAGVIFMFRRLRADELDDKSKYYCKPYKFIKDESTGKWSKSKQYINLDSNKDYIVGFLTKSRYGQDKLCILYERNLAFGTLREIGFCTISEDY